MTYQVGRCLLRYRLYDADMNQQELAERLNIKAQQINKYVLNKRIMSLPVAKNIASVLNCRIEDLYEWIEVGNQ